MCSEGVTKEREAKKSEVPQGPLSCVFPKQSCPENKCVFQEHLHLWFLQEQHAAPTGKAKVTAPPPALNECTVSLQKIRTNQKETPVTGKTPQLH